MDGMMFFVVGWILLVILAILFVLNLPEKSTQEQLAKLPGVDFLPTQMYRGSDGMAGLAVNEETYQLCLLKNATSLPRIVPVKDLIGAFLVKNGELIGQGLRTRPKKIHAFLKIVQNQITTLIDAGNSSQAGGSNQRIDLIVAVHDEEEPLYVVNFLDMETKEGGILYEKSIGTAKHWHSLLDGLILKADHLEHIQGDIRDSNTEISSTSVATEIEKLAELVENRLMTKQEFEAQKEKILTGKACLTKT
ncbi:MAG: SHOCT domain-containing protein [Nitrospirales bacterium]|nr:SHOCT domain-containing protein [Nitrospirales bacterium]